MKKKKINLLDRMIINLKYKVSQPKIEEEYCLGCDFYNQITHRCNALNDIDSFEILSYSIRKCFLPGKDPDKTVIYVKRRLYALICYIRDKRKDKRGE